MNDFTPNPLVLQELEKVSQVWDNLIENMHTKSNKDRITSILVQVMLEYYIDRILIINKVDSPKKIYKMRYDSTLEKLKELNLIDNNLEHDLLNFYEIRNIYAHEIEIHEKQILDLVNGVKTVKDPTRFIEKDRFQQVFQIILRQVQRTFEAVLVREQEKSEENTHSISQNNSSFSRNSLRYCEQQFWLL
ncbi:MAG: hypothetical protein IIA81_01820 [Thaumarchaeota archaeon]|nr:hypothetical protein [Nitrososphaerota archaeon]